MGFHPQSLLENQCCDTLNRGCGEVKRSFWVKPAKAVTDALNIGIVFSAECS
jgi:hypothetical protein